MDRIIDKQEKAAFKRMCLKCLKEAYKTKDFGCLNYPERLELICYFAEVDSGAYKKRMIELRKTLKLREKKEKKKTGEKKAMWLSWLYGINR